MNILKLSQVFLEVHTTSPLEMEQNQFVKQFLPFLYWLSFIFSSSTITWMYFVSNGFKHFSKCIYINTQFNPFSHRIPMVPCSTELFRLKRTSVIIESNH